MKRPSRPELLCLALLAAAPAHAPAHGIAKPELLLDEQVTGMPRGPTQQIRVLTATLRPGDRTVFHSHRFPVSVHVLDGAFTLEMTGRDPVVVSSGEAFVEPPGVSMTGYNRSAVEPVRVVIFYVSDPGTPFLDPIP